MVCAELDWAIIACFDQHFKMHFYPVLRDQALIDVMLKAYAEFWHLVDTDGDYPPIEGAEPDKLVDISEMLPKTNHDLQAMCADISGLQLKQRPGRRPASSSAKASSLFWIPCKSNTPRCRASSSSQRR